MDPVRAWKDPEYRRGLSDEHRGALPEHPAGMTNAGAGSLYDVVGGAGQAPQAFTQGCPTTNCFTKFCTKITCIPVTINRGCPPPTFLCTTNPIICHHF